jgi:hypothetical protein
MTVWQERLESVDRIMLTLDVYGMMGGQSVSDVMYSRPVTI